MRILVTGGAGYIGSHTVVQLLEAGYDVIVADNFVNSAMSVVGRIGQIVGTEPDVLTVDLVDKSSIERVAAEHFDAVIHFAGLKSVGESTRLPLKYYETNLRSTLNLLAAMELKGVRTLAFSSSATVYGAEPQVPSRENHSVSATNPYGWTKVMAERMLVDLVASDPRWAVATLRYFNPVGAHPSALIGENPTQPPNNLMPIVAEVAAGERDRLDVFGGDYDTPDGTGIRDFIHVQDLACGHIRALDALTTSAGLHTWNLGTGRGASVLDLIGTFEEVSGRPIPRRIVDRRPGDVAVSYADPSAAARDLDWRAERDLRTMCEDTWRWTTSPHRAGAAALGVDA